MRKLLAIIWHKKALIILLAITCILRSIVVLWLNSGYASLIDNVLASTYEFIKAGAVILIIAGTCQVIIILIQHLLSSMLAEGTGFSLKMAATEGILKSKYDSVDRISGAESMSKLNTDLDSITSWIKNELSAILSDAVMFIILLAAMLVMNWRLTIASFFMLPFLAAGSYLLSKPITKNEAEKNRSLSDVNIIIKSTVDAFPIAKLFSMEKPLMAHVKDKIDLSIRAETRTNNITAKLMSINGFFSYIPITILLGYGGYLVITGVFGAGMLLAFINMSSFIRSPLLNLPARICAVRAFTANVSRVFSLLDKFNVSSMKNGDDPMNTDNKTAISFSHVNFGYPGSEDCLKNLSFTIPYGAKVAIVGESGCGKSTLLKLITGLYYPHSGGINVLGSCVREDNIQNIRKSLSYVPQCAQLFPASIFENITCGHEIDRAVVRYACRAAGLEEFIQSLPEGIDTLIGEHGANISGGQQQRISIARAIARGGHVFLLDEATSALDAQTEHNIMNHFLSLDQLETVVFVTHKLKNAVDADIIICMKNGSICEMGTHDELIRQDGYYSLLFKIQNMMEVVTCEDHRAAVG